MIIFQSCARLAFFTPLLDREAKGGRRRRDRARGQNLRRGTTIAERLREYRNEPEMLSLTLERCNLADSL